jgi:hypothetical protein
VNYDEMQTIRYVLTEKERMEKISYRLDLDLIPSMDIGNIPE